MLNEMQEKRSLKRSRLGPPDVYPQEPKQKEDELSSANVKHGFSTSPQVQEEFGTARNCNVTASKVGAYFNAILAKREELMTLPDSGRKKQQINPKDNFWPVTVRSKATLDVWFKDLAGNKPLISLAKKAPSFNKKEEIFTYLSDNQVSMQKAAWFIKLSSAYTVAVSEAKIKKRQMPDPATEWTGTIIKFMKDLLPKLAEHYHQGPLPEKLQNQSNSSINANPLTPVTVPQPLTSPASSIHSPANASSTPSSATGVQNGTSTHDDYKTELKHWNYCSQFCKYLYEEGLLDRHEFLNWVLDLLDRMRSQPGDDGLLKLFLPMTLQYMADFVQSERLSRRLAYLVCKKLSHIISSAVEAKEPNGSNHIEQLLNKGEANENSRDGQNDKKLNTIETLLHEYLTCPHHRDIVMQLSTILQIITIECPTALVWCGLGDNRAPSALVGSPLDHLPIPPSALPMPVNCATSPFNLKRQIEEAEENIQIRSKHAEAKWCTEKWQNKNSNSSAKILTTLDALDTHCFDRMDANSVNSNNLDTLYTQVFPVFTPVKQEMVKGEMKETRVAYDPESDAPIVQILCEWAVSWQRWGEHRAMAVAWLLDKRQSEVMPTDNDNVNGDDKDSIGSGCALNGGVPVFQSILMHFLDFDAPVLDENGSNQHRAQFTNLVHLFCELIRHDVFSHDAYMCTLISRGDLLNTGCASVVSNAAKSASGNGATGIPSGPATGSNRTSPATHQQQLDEEMYPPVPFSNESDDNVDDDLDKLLQNINHQHAIDNPDSPKESDPHANTSSHIGLPTDPPISRHFLYAKHFPLCQDDPVSQHDCNQRYILLFGVGKERDEKKHAVKKMSKEICKLFSKKFSIDVAEGGKVKKHSRNEFNFESTTNKCQSMSYFDQHVVTWQCTVTVQEMLNSFAMGNSNYLPVHEHVAFLFDLMEMALNIYGLIDMCIQILKELPEVEMQLMSKNSILVKSYTTCLSLYVVGVLRRYHCCLLLSHEQTSSVFEGLCKVVKHVTNPGDCSSAERCILAYLFDLYSSCSLLKNKPHPTEPFHNAYPKIKQALFAPVELVAAAHPYNMMFMTEVFANPRRGGKIDPAWGRQLNQSPSNRYSFVCNALIAVSRETDNDRLNDIATTCAELTACCNSLSVEWICAMIALCGSSNEAYYTDILGQIDIQNLSIHNSLAVFMCILVARHCFTLETFVVCVALPTLVNACNGGREITPQTEAGARLSCHLLLRLFKTIEIPQPGLYSVGTSPNPITAPGPICNIKLSCDRHLLAAAHKSIAVGPVLAVLKGILVVGDATCQHKPPSSTYSGGKRSGLNTPVHPGSTPKSLGDLSHILGTSDSGLLGDGDDPMLDLSYLQTSTQNENTSSLSDFAQHVLRQICSQEWVLERCLQNPEELCQTGMLIDQMLTSKQAQRLLHMICYPEAESNLKADMDPKSIIVRILENLEQWSLRISWLDLTLMFKQTVKNSPEQSNWLDMVAGAAIDVFHEHEDVQKNVKLKSSIWLVAPLVAKLGKEVQGRILRVAGNVLESSAFFSCTKKEKEENNDDSNESNDGMDKTDDLKPPQLSHKAFLGLILTCLKAQDDQKEDLLSSLHTQLTQFLQAINEFEDVGGIEDPQGREQMLDALQLRFSLIGGMFDAIQKNSTPTSDWAILLTQLMCQSAIDLTTNSELFTTVLDMLATLIHSTLISDSQSERDENKKLYTNLMKKLKKELGEKSNASVRFVRQLLPLSKQTCEVIACESAGCLTDTKGNKISGFSSIDKKPGLRLSDKQRLNVWDLLEGHKNPAPLSWAWVGAVKMERRPLAYEETHRLLKYHTHSLVKPSSYYYEPLQLPPEDLEPLPEKLAKDEMKADTPSSVDQSPSASLSAGGRGRGKGAKRPKKTKATTPAPVVPVIQPQQSQQQQQQQNMMQQQPQMHQTGPQQQQQMQNQQMGQNNPMHMQMNMQQQQLNNPMQQQYQPNNVGGMQQAPNQMINQMQSGPNGMSANALNQQGGGGQQVPGMGFVPNAQQQMVPGGVGGGPQQQQQQQSWGGFNPMQQQQQQQQQPQHQPQQFYQQNMSQQINRFDRPAIHQTNSKQAITMMLRQRNPTSYPPGNQAGGAPQFNIAQQRQHQQQLQQQQAQMQQQQLQQQQQQQQTSYGRNPIRPMNPPQMAPNQMGANAAMGVGPNMGGGMAPNMNTNAMMNQQTGQMAQSQLPQAQQPQQQQQQQQGIAPNTSAGGLVNPVSGNMMNQSSAGNMLQTPMGQSGGMMGQQQPGVGMVNQQQAMNNAGGVPGGGGMPNMAQQSGGQGQGMFAGQQQQFGGMNQNFGGGYGNQGMVPQGNHPQNMPMGNFNQMNTQRNQVEYMSQQQRSMTMQQQQQQQSQNRGQFLQSVPNVTMNNMTGRGAAPPYQQGQSGGKPGGAGGPTQQQYQQQLRLRQQQQQLLLQQQQGMGGQLQQGMQPNQQPGQPQGLAGQQSPALVAQLQQQRLPNQQQQQQGMMNQPYSQHQNQQY